jgi:hypothetical protein
VSEPTVSRNSDFLHRFIPIQAEEFRGGVHRPTSQHLGSLRLGRRQDSPEKRGGSSFSRPYWVIFQPALTATTIPREPRPPPPPKSGAPLRTIRHQPAPIRASLLTRQGNFVTWRFGSPSGRKFKPRLIRWGREVRTELCTSTTMLCGPTRLDAHLGRRRALSRSSAADRGLGRLQKQRLPPATHPNSNRRVSGRGTPTLKDRHSPRGLVGFLQDWCDDSLVLFTD